MLVGMAGFEPTTTTPQCSALPDCATSRKIIYNDNLHLYIVFIENKIEIIQIYINFYYLLFFF